METFVNETPLAKQKDNRLPVFIIFLPGLVDLAKDLDSPCDHGFSDAGQKAW